LENLRQLLRDTENNNTNILSTTTSALNNNVLGCENSAVKLRSLTSPKLCDTSLNSTGLNSTGHQKVDLSFTSDEIDCKHISSYLESNNDIISGSNNIYGLYETDKYHILNENLNQNINDDNNKYNIHLKSENINDEIHKLIEKLYQERDDLLIKLRDSSKLISSLQYQINQFNQIDINKNNHYKSFYIPITKESSIKQDNNNKSKTPDKLIENICKLLDITNISEIIPYIEKLKMIICIIPKLEAFIMEISSIVQGNDVLEDQVKNENENSYLHTNTSTILDNILLNLKIWQNKVKSIDEINQFEDILLNILLKGNNNYTMKEIHLDDECIQGVKDRIHNIDNYIQNNSLKNPQRIQIIHIIINLMEALNNRHELESKKSELQSYNCIQTEQILIENPGLIISKLLKYILNLFHIKSLDELLPRLNQISVFHQEFKSFLDSMRIQFNLKNESDYIVLESIKSNIFRLNRYF
jgi:hypothetical protein